MNWMQIITLHIYLFLTFNNLIYSFRQKFYLFNNVLPIRVLGLGFIGIDSVFYGKGALAYRSSTVGGYMSL